MTMAEPGTPPTMRERPQDPIAELRFLHDLLGIVTTAQTWEELLETVVDGTRDALGASVSSLYLLDCDGTRLTLAATNGLDRFQIGRAVVPFGEGITGRVAAMREPMVIPDVAADPRFLWVRGLDQRRFVASMLSVPLTWHDQVVGVLNVQTEEHREFATTDVDQLSAIADLLAGIVEKGRLQREAEAQVEQLKALDQARNELIALVTHELRTPLAVVRAYTDLLADEPVLEGRKSRDPVRRATRAAWHRGTLEQVERLDRLVDSILESVRVVPDRPPDLRTIDLGMMVDELLGDLGPLLARHRFRIAGSRRLHAMADRGRLRQVLEHLLENAVKYAPSDTAIEIDWR
ncbi:MAG TPA: GAF domain-containing protein, partial [Candidatus Limnocylindrales bacterium]